MVEVRILLDLGKAAFADVIDTVFEKGHVGCRPGQSPGAFHGAWFRQQEVFAFLLYLQDLILFNQRQQLVNTAIC